MTEWRIRPEAVAVADAEYRRLLGYPSGAEMSERAAELAAWARDWYARHGHPWIYVRTSETGALAAVSAGPEAEEEARRLWTAGRPDEYFFLEMFASAVVEHLLLLARGRLCAWAEPQNLVVLPHSSPGYGTWDVAEQPALLQLIRNGAELPGPLGALDSGALVPKKSQLAVFAIAPADDRTRRLAELAPCQTCALANCQFRRAPVRYSIPEKALRRWADERLVLTFQPGGSVRARFRYDGTTCNNLGTPLTFEYDVTLGPREEGYPILEQRCAPAAGDMGHRSMCRPDLACIDQEKPLAGQPLRHVFDWRRPALAAGCYCESESRAHKWGLVLETIHYALHHER
jgi:hypothetical protein